MGQVGFVVLGLWSLGCYAYPPESGCRPLSEVQALPPALKDLLMPLLLTIKLLEPHERDLQSFESFASVHAITSGVVEAGMAGLPFDKAYSEHENILNCDGFQRQLEALLRVETFGLCWGAQIVVSLRQWGAHQISTWLKVILW
jgi:hypothetical protein